MCRSSFSFSHKAELFARLGGGSCKHSLNRFPFLPFLMISQYQSLCPFVSSGQKGCELEDAALRQASVRRIQRFCTQIQVCAQVLRNLKTMFWSSSKAKHCCISEICGATQNFLTSLLIFSIEVPNLGETVIFGFCVSTRIHVK